MSIFAKLFRSPDERQVDRILEKSGEDATRMLAPLSALSGAIILASQKCRDGVKPWIVASDEKDRHMMECFAFYEFVYFFLHLTIRLAFVAMTATERQYIGKCLFKVVGSVCVDGTFENLPDDLRKKMIAEFGRNLQAAEYEYSKCAPGDIFSDSKAAHRGEFIALSAAIGDNVALAIGQKDNSELKSEISTLSMQQFGDLMGEMNLLKLVLDFKRDSMELPADLLS
jgi:hypothetical protein